MHIVQVRQTLKHSECNERDDVNVDGAYFLVDPVEGALVHKLYTHADVGVGQVGAVEGYDVFGMTVVHDL